MGLGMLVRRRVLCRQGHRVLLPLLQNPKHVEVLHVVGELLHLFRNVVCLEGCGAWALVQRLGMH